MPGGEVLLVGAGEQIAKLRRWPVLGQVEPDVLVLRADLDDLAEIAQHGRLAIGRLSDGGTKSLGDESVLDELDEGAQLFVRAWRERPLSKPDRRGEGLSWDAPGFEPPDRPAR